MPLESPEPKSFADMTAAERAQLLRRRELTETQKAMEIGGGNTRARRATRLATRGLAVLGVGAAFVLGFLQFTGSWRIAMIVVGLMGVWMIAVGRMVEGRADRLD